MEVVVEQAAMVVEVVEVATMMVEVVEVACATCCQKLTLGFASTALETYWASVLFFA